MARSYGWPARPATGVSRYDGLAGHRYEAKALREGRQPAYLTFLRKHDAG